MELQFEKQSCRCLNQTAREVKNEEITQEVKLSDGMPDIGRVLATWGQVVLRSKEWRGDRASVSGGVMIWVLYVPEDGTDLRCVDTWLPFTVKWDVSVADREGVIRAMPLLRFADSRALSARKIMVRAGVAVLGEMLCPMEAFISQPGEVPADVELLKNTYPMWLPKEAGEKTFVLDEELTLPSSSPAVEKILSFSIQPEITDQKVMAGKLVFRGSANLHLVYRCSEGKLHSLDIEIPISQFQDLEKELNGDLRADAAMAVTSLELDPEEDGRLRLKCGLVCQYVVQECRMGEVVQDAYSPRRSVQPVLEELSLPVVLDKHKEVISARQSLPGKTGQIVDVCFLPDFPRQLRTGEIITMEIPGMFQVLYYGVDGTLQSASARWEGLHKIEAAEGNPMNAAIIPQGQAIATSGGDSMDLQGKLQLTMDTIGNQGIPMVSSLEIGEPEEPDPGRPSLILCRPEGESLWNLAKRMGSTVGAIREANGIEEPERDQMLLIPVS